MSRYLSLFAKRPFCYKLKVVQFGPKYIHECAGITFKNHSFKSDKVKSAFDLITKSNPSGWETSTNIEIKIHDMESNNSYYDTYKIHTSDKKNQLAWDAFHENCVYMLDVGTSKII